MTDVLVINNNPDNLPGSYTQQLIARVHEAGLQSWEARSVDALNSLAQRVHEGGVGSPKIGLIVSCGSPVELTEAVDLRAHVCKTTAAMLHFPEAPVVGICYGMQLLALLYGGLLREQREAPHRGVWAEMRRTSEESRLLRAMPSRFSQKASNYIFVERLPQHFVATALDLMNRVMAMEHVRDHVYGIQWHPEVIQAGVGRHLLECVFGLLGKSRHGAGCEPLKEPIVACLAQEDVPEVTTLHEVDLELRRVVKDLVLSAGKRAAVELGKVLAGKRKELMTSLRSFQVAGGDGDLSSACAVAQQDLREVAAAWLNNPAPAG